MTFPRIGLGAHFANTFDRAIASGPGTYPNVRRGQTLFAAADFSGQHSGQHFDTYAFLFLDLDRNQSWLSAQREFRKSILRAPRRMAFKSMNDNKRRRALVPFLRLANEMEGCLFLFAISKTGGSMFSVRQRGDANSDILALWKPRVQERLLRILHLSGFLTAGLSVSGQDLLWIVDKDEIASNVDQLTQLTKVFARISSHYLAHDLRNIRCGTTGSDDGSLALEDLTAIPDLTAGALSEVGTAMVAQGLLPRKGIINPVPRHLSNKCRLIASWLAQEGAPLRRFTFLVELDSDSPGCQLTHMRWHAV